jgi:GxxExxY protein
VDWQRMMSEQDCMDYEMDTIKKVDINDLTHSIIGCAMQVHRVLGNGFQEVIYQRALAIELRKQGLSFVREMEMNIYYDGFDIGTRRVDFFVEDKVMVELKAIERLEDVHKAQAINYCEAYNIADGLLINFGGKSLDFKRVYNKNLVNVLNTMKELQVRQDRTVQENPLTKNPEIK